MRWIGIALVSIAAVLSGVACGGESAPTGSKEVAEEPAKVEDVAEKKQGSEEKDSVLDCQLAKAEAEIGAAGVEGLVAEWHVQEVEPRLEDDLSSAVAEAEDLPTFLAERGYVC